MSKAGNSRLRAPAYRMAVVGVQHNPVIAAHYARKRAAGNSKMERPRAQLLDRQLMECGTFDPDRRQGDVGSEATLEGGALDAPPDAARHAVVAKIV